MAECCVTKLNRIRNGLPLLVVLGCWRTDTTTTRGLFLYVPHAATVKFCLIKANNTFDRTARIRSPRPVNVSVIYYPVTTGSRRALTSWR